MRSPTSIFANRPYALLWSSQTISFLGTQITYVALPLTAVVFLQATPLQAGLLGSLEQLPFLLFGLLVGVIVDRRARRGILIWSNVVRLVALGWVPVAFLTGLLTITQLYLVVFLLGSMTVFFEIAYMSYLPTIVERDRLVEANAKLQASSSVAEVAGPGLAGALISVISTPLVLVADALSYLVSVVMLARMPRDVAPVVRDEDARSAASLASSLREGFAVIWGHVLLRWCTAAVVLLSLGFSAVMSLYFLFLVREVGMGSVQVGLVVALGSVGALVGALLAERLTRVLGLGPALVLALALPSVGFLGLAAVHDASLVGCVTAGLATFVGFLGIPVFDITVISARQAVTPEHLQGRASATVRTLSWGTLAIGALLGGVAGEVLGLRAGLVVSAAAILLAPLLLAASPVRSLRVLETTSPDEVDPAVGTRSS
jgi:MFS family permease